MTTARGTATFTSWVEDPPYDGDAGLPRLASATVAFEYQGDLVATSTGRYVLSYGPDGAGVGVGYEELTGSLGGAEGTMVLRHEDVFDERGVVTRWTIVEGSGTGAFAGYTGEGGFEAPHGSASWDWALDYRAP
jgi:hypothetical protein